MFLHILYDEFYIFRIYKTNIKAKLALLALIISVANICWCFHLGGRGSFLDLFLVLNLAYETFGDVG
jgi:hypothetical protein